MTWGSTSVDIPKGIYIPKVYIYIYIPKSIPKGNYLTLMELVV